jgi:class 3 adenylate cyclase
VAQRLEQFGKEIDDATSDVIIVASAAVADRLPPEIPRHPLGTHVVLERAEPMALFRLDLAPLVSTGDEDDGRGQADEDEDGNGDGEAEPTLRPPPG